MRIGDENKLEGKNAIFEALNAGRSIRRLFVLKGNKDDKINKLIDNVKREGAILMNLSIECP